MKRYRTLSLILALTLILSLLPVGVFAESESGQKDETAIEMTQPLEDVTVNPASVKELPNGSTIEAVNINGGEPATNKSPAVTGYSQTFTYKVHMAKAGTLAVRYASEGSCYAKVNNKTSDYIDSDAAGDKIVYYYFGSGGTYSLSFDVYDTGASAYFKVYYAPATVTLTPTKTEKYYILGRPSNYKTVSKFKMKVGSAGYLNFVAGDVTYSTYKANVYYKTSGFKDFDDMSSNDALRWIGVKKGTYTFSVKSNSPMYGVSVKFTKVKQGKYGTKKKKAKTIKKKATRKGLMITNAKKAHWYKFKNPKLKKVKITIKGKVSGVGRYSGLKVTVYNKRGSSFSEYFRSNNKSITIKPYTLGKGNKLAKGTYYIKVESYKSGNGYFSVKWK